MEILEDADDMAWCTRTLIHDVWDTHNPAKSKLVKRQSFSSMDYELWFFWWVYLSIEIIGVYQNYPIVIKIRDSCGDTNEATKDFEISEGATGSNLKISHRGLFRYLKIFYKNLNTRLSMYDNTPAKLLSIAHAELALPKSNLMNNTMGMNAFLDKLKCADVSPVFKNR